MDNKVDCDEFDLMLRKELLSASSYLNDHGFSAAVMQALPTVSPKVKRARRLSALVVMVGIMMIVGIVVFQLLGRLPLQRLVQQVSQASVVDWLSIGAVIFSAAMLFVLMWFLREVKLI